MIFCIVCFLLKCIIIAFHTIFRMSEAEINTNNETSEPHDSQKEEEPQRHLKSSDFPPLPLTTSERLQQIDPEEYNNRPPDAPEWFDRKLNRKQVGYSSRSPLWAAPTDARYPQIKMGRHCYDYYVDYYRCKTLLGEDHEPCKFFLNSFKDVCPSQWIETFDEWRENGVFPAKFDR